MKTKVVHLSDHSIEQAKIRFGWGQLQLKRRIDQAMIYGLKHDQIKGKMLQVFKKSVRSNHEDAILFNNVIYMVRDETLVTLWAISAKDLKRVL